MVHKSRRVVDPGGQSSCSHPFSRPDDSANLQLFALGHQVLQEGGVTALVRPHPVRLVKNVVVRSVHHLERHIHDLLVGERLRPSFRSHDWFVIDQLRNHRVQLRWVTQIHRIQYKVTYPTTGSKYEDGVVVGLRPITGNNVILLLNQCGVVHHLTKRVGVHGRVHEPPTTPCSTKSKRSESRVRVDLTDPIFLIHRENLRCDVV